MPCMPEMTPRSRPVGKRESILTDLPDVAFGPTGATRYGARLNAPSMTRTGGAGGTPILT